MDLYGAFSDRLRVLKEALSIANKQAFTWQRFEASVRVALNASPRTTDTADGHSGYPSLPSALGSELQKTLFRVEACRALLESVDALYAVLSDRQRRLADRLLSPVLKDVLTASSDMHGLEMAA
jgi:hypothetical protein